MRALLGRFAIVFVAMGVVLAFGQHSAGAATINVTAGNFYFCSPSFENGVCDTVVHVGDTVNWNFLAGTATTHTTTECGANCDTPTGSPLWDATRAPGTSFSRVFNTPGIFLYQCNIHTSLMRGRILVIPAGVGGIARLPNVDGATPLEQPAGAGTPAVVAGLVAAAAASVIALSGAAWYVRRRWLT